MSWYGFLNYCILQWLFMRLVVTVDDETDKVVSYRLSFGVVPGTGWGTPYRFVFGKTKL